MGHSVTRRTTDLPAERVWSVVADGWSYAAWVVGASRVRAVSPDWPEPGARLLHTVGSWPVLLDDRTEVLTCTPARRLVLRGRAWPAGEARVELDLVPEPGGGCTVLIREDAVAGPALLLPPPVRHAMLHLRNRETLTRLEMLARRSTA